MDQTIDPTTHRVASRSRDLAMSAIKEMSIRSAQIPDAASLAWGLPSFRTPEPIREAVAQALEGDLKLGMYTLPGGLPEVCEAAAAAHERRTGQRVDPKRNITITAGNMEGLNTLFAVLIDPGDEVIVTDPGFVSHISQIRFNGGIPVYWKMHEDRDWEPDIAGLTGLVGPRTKAIVLVTPSNPTGSILSEAALHAVAEIARAHGLLVILDDPYSHFIYENHARYFNLAALPECAQNIVYLFTFSKCYAMSGWRAGYMVMPADLRADVVKVHDLTMICAPRISQIAAQAALQADQSHLALFESTLDRRRQLICDRLDRLGHVFHYVRPQGAYYVFPRVLVAADGDVSFAHQLLDQAHVAVTPGSAFGPSGKNHVRMAFCVEDDVINTAFDRMEAYFGT
ncbi:pyridoxal phosphate-dependent aminotransferase [Roseobacter sp. YSTF-M11]|uniref:Pyridoxal phosphate-dependent aminotransferase n=1 Tax=Roseobacter insulae TaxID=2859783 RepID=A0A9X1FS76_9RHOB|nr:pyridoxal phosphate-dependent aminotransferase [Roseobacter insulae]MBW4706806.1 pyridoxal phosphate-dependent aminotransferase [Roseobacter insulae]